MSVLKLLHSYLDLDNQSLQELTEQEIIRIEKRLKADVKLNQRVTINDVDTILTILRNHKAELKMLYHPWYRTLREILMQPAKFAISTQQVPFQLSDDENFKKFIQDYFGKTLLTYAGLCVQQDHFNALNTLLLYREILPAEIPDDLSKKCLQKIQFGTECIRLKTDKIQVKIDALVNPFFYRCLNRLGAIQFESAMIDLLNTAIEVLQSWNRAFFIKLLYAAGFFEPIRSDLKTVFEDNQKMAFGHGAREKKYGAFDKDQKGGTHQVTSGIYSEKRGSRNGVGPGLRAFGGGVAIIFILIKVLLLTTRNSNNNTYTPPDFYEMPSYKDNLVPPPQESFDSSEFKANEKALFMQSDKIVVRNTRTISFDQDEARMAGPYKMGGGNNLTYINKTSQPVILLFSHGGALFLDQGQEISVHSINNTFAVYTGVRPQMVTYKDSNDVIQEDFRFRYFTKSDEETLRQIYDFSSIGFQEECTLEIRDERSYVEVVRLNSVQTLFEQISEP